jgi:hypothetical protein
VFSNVVFVGDGKNDYCAMAELNDLDLVTFSHLYIT